MSKMPAQERAAMIVGYAMVAAMYAVVLGPWIYVIAVAS